MKNHKKRTKKLGCKIQFCVENRLWKDFQITSALSFVGTVSVITVVSLMHVKVEKDYNKCTQDLIFWAGFSGWFRQLCS